MEFRILGALEVRDRHGQVVTLSGHKPRALVAVLLLNANRLVTVDRLIQTLWEGAPPDGARHGVHLLVYRTRRVLAAHDADGRLRTRDHGYLLTVEPGELDADEFEQRIRLAGADAAGGRLAEAVKGYDAALALWEGPPLTDFAEAPFARPTVARLEELRAAAATGRAEALLAMGRHIEVVPTLEELTRSYPLQERLTHALMLALYRSGRQADALAVYQTTRGALIDQLGLEPGEDLQQLQRAILTKDASLAAPVFAGASRAPQPANALVSDPGRAAPGTSGPPAPLAGASRRSGAAARAPDQAERRVVTVLAAKVGTARSARADPEDLWAQHAATMGDLRAEIERLGGVVLTDTGHLLLATFGARRAHTDDPTRAVRAATVIGDLEDPDSARISIGIDTGEAVVVTSGGQDAPPHLTGAVMHAATVLASLAPPGGVLAGPTTYEATARTVAYRPVELSGPELADVGGAAWQVIHAGSPSLTADSQAPMTGRQRELAVLGELLDRTRHEREPQLVTIVGAPGLGKTRLVQELRERAQADDRPVTWHQGRSLPYGEGVTFWALAEIVKTHTRIPDTDHAEEAERKLRQMVEAAFGDTAEAVWAADYLARLVLPERAAEDDIGWQAEAFTAWRRFLEVLAGDRPLVLVFDDLHWADDAMLDFIEHLADQVESVPMLVVCVAWPELLERRSGWGGGKRNATTISLGPLPPGDTEQLLDELLGRQPEEVREHGGHDGRAQLLAGSGGNPLFVEEYVRMLSGRGTGPRPAPDVLHPPETLKPLIAARVDDLEPDDRALLADAAVLGEVVWTGALAAISGRDDRDIAVSLRRLTRREFLRRIPQSSIPGQAEYTFRHILIRDVAYGRLLRADRADRHRHAAGWLEALGEDRAADRAELIAYHYQQAVTYARAAGQPVADLGESASQALRRAGDRALALGAVPSALRYYDQALELWPAGLPGRLELVLTREWIRFELDDDADADLLAEARDGLLATGDRVAAATAATVLAALMWTRGQSMLATQHLEQARALLRGTPPSEAKVWVIAEMAANLVRLNRIRETLEVGLEGLAMARSLGLRKLEAAALGPVGAARAVLGDPAGAEDLRRSASTLAEVGSAWAPRNFLYLFVVCSHLGDLAGMTEARTTVVEAAERLGSSGLRIWSQVTHVIELYMTGEWDHALAVSDALISLLQDAGGHYSEAFSRNVRGKVRLARGDVDGAFDDAAVALEAGRDADEYALLTGASLYGYLHIPGRVARGDRGEAARVAADLRGLLPGRMILPSPGAELADLLATFGQVPEIPAELVRVSPWLQAVIAFGDGQPEQAADIYARTGNRADEALARLRAGERSAAAGRPAHAADQLSRARAFYQEVRATFYLRQIDTLLARVRTT